MVFIGVEIKTIGFTEILADKPAPKILIASRQYTLPNEIKSIYRQAIRREKKINAEEPDAQCAMKDCNLSILIPIYKKKEAIAVPANNQPLRRFLILKDLRVGDESGTVKNARMN